jgi:release factor glutamine methyltransferase
MDFAVSSAVLCPRPDTEILVQAALQTKPTRILDLGTGSGAIILSLLKELPYATGIGIDISPQALEIARKNAEHLGLASRADFLLGSWCDGLSDSFDLIVSNPPYIESSVISGLTPEVAEFEPKLALDGGMDGLDAYRALIPQLQMHLGSSGWVVLEIGKGQEFAVQQLMSEHKLENFSIAKDYQGIDRCVIAQRI